MTISPRTERPSWVGPAEYFTGNAVIDPLFMPNDHRHAGASVVTFSPGARTVWHTHPAGQTLIVTEGIGWIQERGGERRTIHPGDVVWFAPGVEHWHGASETHGMTHIALQEAVGGEAVDWLSPVTNEEYGSGN